MRINLPLLIVGILASCYWISSYFIGFFLTTIFSIIIGAIVGLWIRLTGRG